MYDGIMQGTCLGSIFFGILTLDLMEEADAAAKIASEAHTGNDDDTIVPCQAFCAMYCDDMTCIAKTPDGALEYFIAIEDAMQDALWGESTRMAKKDCFLAGPSSTKQELRDAAERHGLQDRFADFIGSDTVADERGITCVGVPIGAP